ncbi:hypothetical protein APHAL10511_007553 [Amanita phalloides]|nr:hypothetical protein APHAL10511_007553 [Amanita phalloides]
MSEEIILSTAEYHNQLCDAISNLDYVQEALSQQKACVADIDSRYQESERKLRLLSVETKKARKVYERRRDSHTIKLAHTLAGKKDKYAAKGSKEEHDYVEALEREMKEKETFDILQHLRTEAILEYDDLSKKVEERQSFKEELATLYSQIFDGPTSTFPEDDDKKEEVEDARWKREQIQAKISGDREASDLLSRADALMNACRCKLSEAAGYPRWDLWGGMGLNDYAICDALYIAQDLANQAQLLVRQAEANSPLIEDIGRVEIASRVNMPNGVYGATFAADFTFRNRIRACAADLVRAHLHLKLQREAAANRITCAQTQLQEVNEVFDQKKGELECLRSRIFARVVSSRSNGPTDNPPPYEDVPRMQDGDLGNAVNASSEENPQVLSDPVDVL